MNTEAIARTAARADQFAAMKGAPETIANIANLIRHCRGVPGIKWVAGTCDSLAGYAAREDHAAQYRVIAKRLRRSIA